MWVSITMLILGIIAWILSSKISASEKSKSINAISNIPEFTPDVSEIFPDSSALAIDANRKKVAIVDMGLGVRNVGVFEFSDIVAVEVCRDGKSVIKTNRGSQVAGAAVGAILLGPFGLLLGGLTGSKRTEEKISRLSLKIYTNDLGRPVREVAIFSQIPAMKAEVVNKIYGPKADEWYGRLRVIVGHEQKGEEVKALTITSSL